MNLADRPIQRIELQGRRVSNGQPARMQRVWALSAVMTAHAMVLLGDAFT